MIAEPTLHHKGQRYVRIMASPGILRRIGIPSQASNIFVENAPTELWTECRTSCCCELVTCARINSRADEPPSTESCSILRYSRRILLVVVSGEWLIHEIYNVARQLPTTIETSALASAVALKLSTILPSLHGAYRSHAGILIVERLRASIVAEARRPSAETCPAQSGTSRLLPRLLAIAEMTLLALEFSGKGWRTRVHESGASDATASFIRALARVALREAALPFAN